MRMSRVAGTESPTESRPERGPKAKQPAGALSVADVLACGARRSLCARTDWDAWPRLTDGRRPVYGTRWYSPARRDREDSAPRADRSRLQRHEASWSVVAVDEDAGDLVTRLASGSATCAPTAKSERPATLDRIGSELGGSHPTYDDRWTIEGAATDLAKIRAGERGTTRMMLGVDSLQTVRCEATACVAHRPGNERGLGRYRAGCGRCGPWRRAQTDRLGHVELGEVPIGRATMSSRARPWPRRSGPEPASTGSGGSSGCGRFAGETDLIDLETRKTSTGPRDEHVYLRISPANPDADPRGLRAGAGACRGRQGQSCRRANGARRGYRCAAAGCPAWYLGTSTARCLSRTRRHRARADRRRRRVLGRCGREGARRRARDDPAVARPLPPTR